MPDASPDLASPAATAPDAAVVEAAARLRLSATRLARRLRREAGSGLSPTLLSALATVQRHGPLPLGALAELEGVAAPTITRVVARLVGEGLLERRADPDDRRSALVEVTDRGQRLLTDTRNRKTAWLADRLRTLGPAELVALEAALDVLESLTDEPRPEGEP